MILISSFFGGLSLINYFVILKYFFLKFLLYFNFQQEASLMKAKEILMDWKNEMSK